MNGHSEALGNAIGIDYLNSPVYTSATGSLEELPNPKIILFGNVLKKWRLNEPLLLDLEQDDDGQYIVSDDIFHVYGVGQNQSEALNDYVTALIEYVELSHKDRVSDPRADLIPTTAIATYLSKILP